MIKSLLNQGNFPIQFSRTSTQCINPILSWGMLNTKAKYEVIHYMTSSDYLL